MTDESPPPSVDRPPAGERPPEHLIAVQEGDGDRITFYPEKASAARRSTAWLSVGATDLVDVIDMR